MRSNRSSTNPAPRTKPTPKTGSYVRLLPSSASASATRPSAPGRSSPRPAGTSPTGSSSLSSNTAPAKAPSQLGSATSPIASP